MSKEPSFLLTKWYLDCVAESGDATVVYVADLRWNKLSLRYGSLLTILDGRVHSSSSGLWLVSATVILASAALVLGYELPDLQTRFGNACAGQRLLPADDQSVPSRMERIRCYLTVLLPWFLIYEAFVVLGVPPRCEDRIFPI